MMRTGQHAVCERERAVSFDLWVHAGCDCLVFSSFVGNWAVAEPPLLPPDSQGDTFVHLHDKNWRAFPWHLSTLHAREVSFQNQALDAKQHKECTQGKISTPSLQVVLIIFGAHRSCTGGCLACHTKSLQVSAHLSQHCWQQQGTM